MAQYALELCLVLYSEKVRPLAKVVRAFSHGMRFL